MQSIIPGNVFSFTYPTYSETSGLFVRAKIYDVSTGSAVFVANVNLTNLGDGYYFGNYTGVSAATYLVVVNVYTDNTYASIDTNWAPWAEVYKSVDAPAVFSAFDYGVVSCDSSLNIAGDVYDVTSGSAVFQIEVVMHHVFGGVYLGAYSGTSQHTYQVAKFVFTDNTFSQTDTDYSPGSDSFQLFQSTVPVIITNIFKSATLVGQKRAAILVGNS